jgi:hypothetical protein
MTTHYKDIDDVVRLDQITCAECREKVGMELLGDGMTCGESKGYGGQERCTNLKTLELHSCPYSEDVNGDRDALCQCCSDCEHECAMDI